MWLTDNDGRGPTAQVQLEPQFVAKWRSWLETADYAVLSVPQSNYIPWMSDLAEARRKAAQEGKPLYVWTMAGEPLGQC